MARLIMGVTDAASEPFQGKAVTDILVEHNGQDCIVQLREPVTPGGYKFWTGWSVTDTFAPAVLRDDVDVHIGDEERAGRVNIISPAVTGDLNNLYLWLAVNPALHITAIYSPDGDDLLGAFTPQAGPLAKDGEAVRVWRSKNPRSPVDSFSPEFGIGWSQDESWHDVSKWAIGSPTISSDGQYSLKCTAEEMYRIVPAAPRCEDMGVAFVVWPCLKERPKMKAILTFKRPRLAVAAVFVAVFVVGVAVYGDTHLEKFGFLVASGTGILFLVTAGKAMIHAYANLAIVILVCGLAMLSAAILGTDAGVLAASSLEDLVPSIIGALGGLFTSIDSEDRA